MKIVFLSNFYNHHQIEISESLYAAKDVDYNFISTVKLPEEQKKLGYQEYEEEFLIHYYESDDSRVIAQSLIDNADILIVGSAPEKMLKERKKRKKIIIRYLERPFKKGIKIWKIPFYWYKFHKNNPHKNPIYVLCASAYTSSDFDKFSIFRNRVFKWGYFPPVKKYNIEEICSNKKSNNIVWCGRFIDWKHPDDAINIAKMLKEDGYEFCLNMIGTGDMEQHLKKIVHDNNLESVVNFTGSMPPDEVRTYMEKAGIYLFTSDQQEGWGAVLNESMNSGCAVVASHAIGSVPYLLENDSNGLIYESGNIEMMYEKVKYLLENPKEQQRVGMAAYNTIYNIWNARIASERLLNLFKHIMSEKKLDIYDDGPCSRAEIIKDNWIEGRQKV